VSEKNFEFRISDFGFKNKELGGADTGSAEKKSEIRNLQSEIRLPQSDIHYEGVWSLNPKEEKRAFEKFISSVMERRRRYPDMHIYHYGAYEETALKHMAGRHGVGTDEVDELLRGDGIGRSLSCSAARAASFSRKLFNQET
jgi:hypothetical protein